MTPIATTTHQPLTNHSLKDKSMNEDTRKCGEYASLAEAVELIKKCKGRCGSCRHFEPYEPPTLRDLCVLGRSFDWSGTCVKNPPIPAMRGHIDEGDFIRAVWPEVEHYERCGAYEE